MWPDWIGETAIIVGTGPSAADVSLEPARGTARCIAIKSSWQLAPWADALYGLDKGWWIANQGAPQFKGLKLSPSPTACRVFGLTQVRLKPRAELQMGQTGTIGCGLATGGGHSGFQAINLAIQFGAKRILLVGFDMTLANGAHWNSDLHGVGKPDRERVSLWRKALDGCAPQFKSLGIDVVNTGSHSALTAYRKMSLLEALGVKHGDARQGHAVQRELQISRPTNVEQGRRGTSIC